MKPLLFVFLLKSLEHDKTQKFPVAKILQSSETRKHLFSTKHHVFRSETKRDQRRKFWDASNSHAGGTTSTMKNSKQNNHTKEHQFVSSVIFNSMSRQIFSGVKTIIFPLAGQNRLSANVSM
jgi:hypothetical protein